MTTKAQQPKKRTADAFHDFGRHLLAARIRCGLTQKDLAVRCKLDQSYLSRLEQGKRAPAPAQLARLAEALCVPLQWFLTGTFQPGREWNDIALEVSHLGVVDLVVSGAAVPGAFRPPEQVVALVLSGDAPHPRVVEAVPAVLAWNAWNRHLLGAYARSYDPRALHRLAWLADVVLTIDRGEGFPGGCVDPYSLEEFLRGVPAPGAGDDLGWPSADERLPPVSKRWRVTYPADLALFRERAERLLELRRSQGRGGSGARATS
jgi:transcriptional regulator with XRE-family HTH domain